MGLATYEDLKQSIINWSHRSDLDLLIDDFILLAETRMFNNPIEVLEVAGQDTTDNTLTTTGKTIALPADYQSIRSIRLELNGVNNDLRYRAPEQMIIRDASGLPSFFTVSGTNIVFDRVPDAVYTVNLQYFAKPTALSSANPTNTILTNNPDIYLFGALNALFAHANNDIDAANYANQFIAAIRGANKLAKQGRYGPAPAMRIEGATP